MKKLSILSLSAAAVLLAACSEDDFKVPGVDGSSDLRINLSGSIDQLCETRANDDGFADGDVMGVYIVDYQGNNPGRLQNSGNRGDNVRHTFDEANSKWNSAYDLYYKDKNTRIDVYGYYPWGSPENVNSYEFEVRTDQSKTFDDGSMGNYEASDFLWGKAANIEPSDRVIRLPLTHRMANARVTLVKGDDFTDEEWTSLDKIVLVTNTRHNSTIDLATGTVTATGDVSGNAIIPSRRNDEWRAIVVPQAIAGGTQLFSITIGGKPYKFSKNEAFEYVAGKMNNFGIRVDKKLSSGEFQLTLISESITPWENDLVSHDGTAKEYVVINSTAGGLKDAITAAGKDYAQLRNLKITGSINQDDVYFMRDEMNMLQALNLKETKVSGSVGFWSFNSGKEIKTEDYVIPDKAFNEKSTLSTIVLPDTLTAIGDQAFRGCLNLSGSINIPEGVKYIGASAFLWCHALTGSLSLPSTLEYIGGGGAVDIHGAFCECHFTCELKLPSGLKYIGHNAFAENSGYYGNLILPEKLEFLGDNAFGNAKNLTGDLEIPQSLTIIRPGTFSYTGLNGNLKLHDGILSIQQGAFEGTKLKGELTLPKNLTSLGQNVFNGCDFSGVLHLPDKLISIGDKAFAYNWRLMGILEFPEGLQSIGAGAFAHCRSIEGLVFPESLENIRYEASYYEDGGAFEDCYGIGSIVCKSGIPPYVQPGAFNGVAKDNFTLEVPETSLTQYQTAVGWSDFKRIAAHHELVCRPSVACALGTEHKQTLVIDSESEWEIESLPDWCTVTPASGDKKTEVTLTIAATSAGDEREGDVVFRLKDKDYTHRCHVTQYGYEYEEDQFLTLQTATKGNNGGINIVILGDGYEAKDIASGQYLKDMKEEVDYFFGIEPYTTYRDYFNVYTAFPVSTETGVGTINTIRYNRFGTTYTGGVGLRCDYDMVFDYAMNAPTVNSGNLDQTLIIIVPNSSDYGGICQMWESGAAIAFCPKSDYGYPLDTRGVIQHEAAGHGFGKLGDEYIYHNAFIDFCDCTCCGHEMEFKYAKALGWYDNLELTGKTHQVGWSHLIFDPRYSDIVDIFEGGYMHSRGVFRSEQNSCMNNDIPYFSTISRESIVKRIKRYAGEEYSFEDFVANDKRISAEVSRSTDTARGNISGKNMAPVIHKGSPLKNRSRK
ncbi:MAG: leucine-rich repeat protein [Muribaculaceae bacterium]|nr:leucine-rich repeat protein [Muribaculaceae bacterium]